jgi:hypothetical protein
MFSTGQVVHFSLSIGKEERSKGGKEREKKTKNSKTC